MHKSILLLILACLIILSVSAQNYTIGDRLPLALGLYFNGDLKLEGDLGQIFFINY